MTIRKEMTFVNINRIVSGISHSEDLCQIIKNKQFDQQEDYMFAYQQIPE